MAEERATAATACTQCGGSGYQARGCNLFACAKCHGKGVEIEEADGEVKKTVQE